MKTIGSVWWAALLLAVLAVAGCDSGDAVIALPLGPPIYYFMGTDGTDGTELYRSDGTAAGTVRVKDIWPGIGSSFPDLLYGSIRLGSRIYFVADDGTATYDLWVTGGTEASTVRMAAPGVIQGMTSAVPFGTGFMFAAYGSGGMGTELWMSDGTPAGTSLVKDINPGAGASLPLYLTEMNGVMYFNASDGAAGQELWRSDGTPAGTYLVRDLWVGGNGYPQWMVTLGSTLFFSANIGTGDRELWKSDGTTAGTTLVTDLFVGASGSNPLYLAAMGGHVYFRADNGTALGAELFRSDGTAAGTTMVKDIAPDAPAASPSYLTTLGSRVVFTANNGTTGQEPWVTDGTAAGTVQLADINPGGSSSSAYYTELNGALYFIAQSGTDWQLWRTDGTGPGTALVKTLGPLAAILQPFWLQKVGNKLFFAADDGVNGYEPWVSDGTPAGTHMIVDLWPGVSPNDGHYYEY